MNDKYTLNQILRIRYMVMFFLNGLAEMLDNVKIGICSIAAIFFYCFFGLRFIPRIDGPMGKMCLDLYILAFFTIGVMGSVFAVWLIGAPKHYIRIMQNMYRVGLSNAAGEVPVLVSRHKSQGNPKAEMWEFETYGVPFSVWVDYADKIESALDVAFVKAEPGKDGRTVLLTVIPHPGPWPKVLPWNNKLLHPQNSILILGENRCEQVLLDLSITPHILITGRTGSGKSVLQKSLMLQALLHQMEVILVDYKQGVDYSREWPKHCQIIIDDDCFLSKLTELLKEMHRRNEILRESGYPNIDKYNAAGNPPLHRICLVVDEIAECMDRSSAGDKQSKQIISAIHWSISSLCRLGRASGIHVFLATQRGSADILSGQIRNNTFKILGGADENLSILTLGNADAAKKIPVDACGRFINECGAIFQGYYSDYGPEVFAPVSNGDT